MADGRKDDAGKLLWDLVPWEAMEEIVKVLMFGAKEYGEENWKQVADGERRYLNATLRHVISRLLGERHDGKSGLLSLAHAACCVLFLIQLELDERKDLRDPGIGSPADQGQLPPAAPKCDPGV